jgi:hypothetical protein
MLGKEIENILDELRAWASEARGRQTVIASTLGGVEAKRKYLAKRQVDPELGDRRKNQSVFADSKVPSENLKEKCLGTPFAVLCPGLNLNPIGEINEPA